MNLTYSILGGKILSKIIFNEYEINRLEKNPHVKNVSDRSISYHPDFKLAAVKENLKGKGPTQIFIEHGFDLSLIGKEKAKQCLRRWRNTYKSFGEDGFYSERRGLGSTGRPSSKEETAETKLKKAESRIKYLEAELDFLKKLEELERQEIKKLPSKSPKSSN